MMSFSLDSKSRLKNLRLVTSLLQQMGVKPTTLTMVQHEYDALVSEVSDLFRVVTPTSDMRGFVYDGWSIVPYDPAYRSNDVLETVGA